MKLRISRFTKSAATAAIGLTILTGVSVALAKKPKPAKSETAKKPVTKTAGDYFPLRVGDTWTYKNNESGGYTLKVVSEEPQDKASTRFVVELSSGVKILNTYSKTEGWVLLHGERYPEHEGLEAQYDPPRQYLANPPAPGQKWEWSGQDPTQVEMTEKNTAVGIEEVTVRAGKFQAMKIITLVTGGSAPKTRTSWYADGVGLVKTTTEAGQFKYGSELTDYSFKKK